MTESHKPLSELDLVYSTSKFRPWQSLQFVPEFVRLSYPKTRAVLGYCMLLSWRSLRGHMLKSVAYEANIQLPDY